MEILRWQRLERLFAAAEALPPAERAAFVDAAFAEDGDPGLRAELEAMLRATAGSGTSGGVAAAIADGFAAFQEEEEEDENGKDEALPPRLGPYRILREIGRGGMATVYEAERDDREFERKVAVKVIRRGMDSADIVRRLRRERQILANLDHPNIARLLDGGTTADGRPYVVMEHIDGEPIDAYCRRHRLELDARLALFRQVCAAVHFAHRSLVLHRDIKPSNILVTAEGIPKLLDFGIAKVIAGGGDTEAEPEPTRTGWRLLTPGWASPEQVRGEPLTTASDVYSLGLLLYLLVAGRRAYEVDPGRPAELERVVCLLEPPPPRPAGDDGGHRGGAAARLWRRLFPAEELEVVVMNALRKDPARRYASAEQLAEDVRRCRENLPIAARPDTVGYRAGVFARRHRWALALAAATFAALAAIALVAAWQAREARQQWLRAEHNLELAGSQRRQADEQRRRAEQVAALLTGIFEVSDPGEARGRSLTAREVLDQGAARLRSSLADDPDLRAELLGTIGRIYQKLALYDDAQALLEEAAQLRRAIDPASGRTAASLRDLAQLALERGRAEPALELAREALAIFERGRTAPLEIAHSLRQVADAEIQLDRLESAEQRYRQALAIEARLAGPNAASLAATRNGLGELQYRRGAFEPARLLFEQALAARRAWLGGDHPEIAVTLNNLAAAELALGDPTAAERHLREVLDLRRRLFGESHDQVAGALNNLAAALAARGEPRKAIASAEDALAIYRRVLGGEHPRVADGLHNLGQLHQQADDPQNAAAFYRQALELRRKVHGPRHAAVGQTLRNLGNLALERDPTAAEGFYREALAIDRQALPDGDYRIAHSLVGLGRAALLRHDPAAAERAFAEAVEIRRRAMPDDPSRAEAEGWLGHARDRLAPGGEGRRQLEAAVSELEARLGARHARTRVLARLLEEKVGAAGRR